jgi:hypothetical protein
VQLLNLKARAAKLEASRKASEALGAEGTGQASSEQPVAMQSLTTFDPREAMFGNEQPSGQPQAPFKKKRPPTVPSTPGSASTQSSTPATVERPKTPRAPVRLGTAGLNV